MIGLTVALHLRNYKLVSEANNFDHWSTKRKRRDDMKWLLFSAWREQQPTILPREIQLPCTIRLIRIAPRNLDDDNLAYAFKRIRDHLSCMILGGTPGQKDNDLRIVWQYSQEKRKPKEYGIEIRISHNDLTKQAYEQMINSQKENCGNQFANSIANHSSC